MAKIVEVSNKEVYMASIRRQTNTLHRNNGASSA
jgi:hypothetical protein